jgi:hypothetical protein
LKITLYISLYPIDSIKRKDDIVRALQYNISNKFIHSIVILNEGFDDPILHSPKIKLVSIKARPVFSTFFDYLNIDSINIIANNDIRFDHSLRYLKLLFLKKADLLSLTRIEKNGQLLRQTEGDTQDAWIFKGKPNCLKQCDFSMGKLGCDTRLNYLFYKGGYRVLNPSKLISIFHEHTPPFSNHLESERIEDPYLFTKPVGLWTFHMNRILLYYFIKNRVNYIYSE